MVPVPFSAAEPSVIIDDAATAIAEPLQIGLNPSATSIPAYSADSVVVPADVSAGFKV